MSSEIDSFSDEWDSDLEFLDEDIEQTIEVPKNIKINSSITDIHCHPTKNLIAAATHDGPVHLYTYSTTDDNKKLHTYENQMPTLHVKFSPTGEYLFTGSQEGIIYLTDLETNTEIRKVCRKDGSYICTLLPIDNYFLACGEEEGQVVIWDFRKPSPVACFKDCCDCIRSLAISQDKKTLLAVSGEGILNAYDIKSRKLQMQSEPLFLEFLSVGILKAESKVVVGASDGALNIFNWGEYGAVSDRFPGHPGSVECMQVVRDDIVCTGCEDGKIRAVQLFPNRFLGLLGQHDFAVESLSITHDSTVLASVSHDRCIKFWDLSFVKK